jgi:hypothetical protein
VYQSLEQPTAAGRSGAWRAVVVPFVVSRALSDVLLVGAALLRGAHSPLWGFRRWDGRWYLAIAAHGYGALPHALSHQTPWPFFPLFPLVLHAGALSGLPVTFVGLAVNHIAFFLALVAVRRLAVRHATSERVADLSVWFLAVGPLAFVFSMLYPSAIFLATTAWAFVFLDERRDLAAGVLAALAALSRPNGAVVVIALAVAVGWSTPRLARLVAPTAGALIAWMGFNAVRGGDPLRFLSAKAAWHEVDLLGFLLGPTATPALHLALAALAVGVVVAARRNLPSSWTWFSVLYLLPSLALGVVGLARYASEVFPPYVGAATLVQRRSAVLPTVFGLLVAAQIGCALLFVTGHSVI